MNFSFAALPRLVECCTSEMLHGADTDALALLPVLEHLVSEAKTSGLTSGIEEFDTAGHEFWGVPATAHRVIAIAGLVEIAVTGGYLDYTDEEGPVIAAILEGPFTAFEEQVLSHADEAALAASSPGIQLFSRLMERLAAKNLTGGRSNDTLPAVIESYANLTSYVWSDSVFQEFLLDTHNTSSSWIQDDDLAALVTPRHFASAIATGSIREKRATAANGGLAALMYLQWLTDLVASAGDDPIADDFIRHARWAHSIDRIAARLDTWASAMAGWADTERDLAGEAEWRAYVSRVFEPLSARQKTLAIPPIAPQNYWGASVPSSIGPVQPFDEAAHDVEALTAQGRIGAARRIAVEQAANLYAALWQNDDTWSSKAEQLVTSCSMITELGDADVAAAYVAPVRARAERQIESGASFPFAAADAILARCRAAVLDDTASRRATISASTGFQPAERRAQTPQVRRAGAHRNRTDAS